ncbi:GntR family transcriptional regulator [Gryllotalpicola reticulitermitis]|uniref:GntR family transcriptional regulator n=1 Tax=Gryllotalpicola reticulitermitis TaxID=1184153 RepID=A0ABV8Q607_9MICO
MTPPINDGEARTTPLAIAQVLRARIIGGNYAPGEQLVEDRLAKHFGVSRIPVREALRMLEAEGFVDLVPYRGAFVAEVDRDAADHTLEIRAGLEPIAARRAAVYRTEENLDVLRDALSRGEHATEKQQFELLPSLNSVFHSELWSASANGELKNLLDQLNFKIAWVYSLNVRRNATESWQGHRRILDAVEAGDDLGAEAAMRTHIDNAIEVHRRYPHR